MVVFFADIAAVSTEGYAQRVRNIDENLIGMSRTYVSWCNSLQKASVFPTQVETAESRGVSVKHYRLTSFSPLHWMVFLWLVLRCRAIYIHSLYSASSLMARFALTMFAKPVIWDIHGVIPEELEVLGHKENLAYYNRLEELCAAKSKIIVVVSQEMANHIRHKYPHLNRRRFIVIPVQPRLVFDSSNHFVLPGEITDEEKSKDYLLYCGGHQKWQNAELVLKLLEACRENWELAIFTKEVDWFEGQLREKGLAGRVRVEQLDSHRLFGEYRRARFGVIFRDDHVVNRVSCPTKLSEYLRFDVIPVVKSASIGDFQNLGFRFVRFEDAMKNQWPSSDEQRSIIASNRKVVELQSKVYSEGLVELKKALSAVPAIT